MNSYEGSTVLFDEYILTHDLLLSIPLLSILSAHFNLHISIGHTVSVFPHKSIISYKDINYMKESF